MLRFNRGGGAISIVRELARVLWLSLNVFNVTVDASRLAILIVNVAV